MCVAPCVAVRVHDGRTQSCSRQTLAAADAQCALRFAQGLMIMGPLKVSAPAHHLSSVRHARRSTEATLWQNYNDSRLFAPQSLHLSRRRLPGLTWCDNGFWLADTHTRARAQCVLLLFLLLARERLCWQPPLAPNFHRKTRVFIVASLEERELHVRQIQRSGCRASPRDVD